MPCCYLSESLECTELPRDYFLLPPDAPLWGCLQRLEKFVPAFDHILEAIAIAVPDSWFVFVEDRIPNQTQALLDRLARSAPTLHKRMVVLNRMGRQEYLALVACMDVHLDPFPFGSGITLYDSLHTGTPIVTLEGRFLAHAWWRPPIGSSAWRMPPSLPHRRSMWPQPWS